MSRPDPPTPGSVTLTRGFRVAVSPQFLADQSDPDDSRYIFGYRIRITNESERPAQLLARRWLITDAHGHRRAIDGPGVVGQQPVLAPGASFTYSSFCPLPTPWGTMEGAYIMQDLVQTPSGGGGGSGGAGGAGGKSTAPGEQFEIEIGRFFLLAPGE